MAIAADRTEGGIMIEGVGKDSGESEGRAAGVGDGRVERGIGNRQERSSSTNQEFFEIRILQYLDRGAAVFGFQRGP